MFLKNLQWFDLLIDQWKVLYLKVMTYIVAFKELDSFYQLMEV